MMIPSAVFILVLLLVLVADVTGVLQPAIEIRSSVDVRSIA